MKKGKLIKGITRQFKETREKSPPSDPLIIDLKNKVTNKINRQPNPRNVSPLKRGSTGSPSRREPMHRNSSYNQIFELSRVITNSRAPLDNTVDPLIINSTTSGDRPLMESLPDDSLFHPSNDPIKVLEKEQRFIA